MPAPAGPPSSAARAFAWTGALLFVASLSYFLFTYAVTFGETAPAGAARGRAIALNVVLFAVFALHHSVFAREPARAWMAHLCGPGLERACYVWIASGMLAAVCILWQPVRGVAWHMEGAWRWGFVAVQAAGLGLALRSAALIDIFELSGVRQLEPRRRTVEFKAAGPYGWMRHPIYAGWFLMVFFTPAMTMTRLVFAIISSAYVLVAIPLEERSLLRSSGGAYERYTRLVKWKLVPGLY